MRGRILNPFAAEIAQLDVSATAADPDGPGPLSSGYDADFRETVIVPAAPGRDRDARREKASIRVPCQIEVSTFGELQELLSGMSPQSRLTLVFHFQDLERLNLVDRRTGEPLIALNDRLLAIRDGQSGDLIQTIRTPPGLYITELQPAFGLGRTRNLLLASLADRALGPRGIS